MRVHYVKKARKDNSAVNKGEAYYWWKPRYGGKRRSATRPRPSQLCSGRKSEVMAEQENLQDALDSAETYDDIRTACEECASRFRELGEEYRESADNMPESLQYGEQAEAMREMGDSLDTAADSLESLDFDGPDEFDEDEPDEPEEDDFDDSDDYDEAYAEWEADHVEWVTAKEEREAEVADFIENLISEATDASEEVEFLF